MTSYQNFKFGGVDYPLTASSPGANLLSVCDPAIAALTQYIRQVIETHLGTVLIDVSAPINSTSVPNPRITVTVGSTLDIDPVTVPRLDELRFPILAVWRKTSKFDLRTATWFQDTSKIGVAYILPALTVEQSKRIAPILTSVARVVQRALRQAFDPSYNGGETVLTKNGIADATLDSATYDGFELRLKHVETPDGLVYRCVVLDLTLIEQLMPSTAGYVDLLENRAVITDESIEPGNPVEVAYVRD